MKVVKTKIPGVFILEPPKFQDVRGDFVKTFHGDTFKKHGLDTRFKEGFYSISKKHVIRGMHFHLPPKDHTKLIYVTEGAILDVVLDLRKGSPTYGKHISVELSKENNKSIYIPRGCAHGFLSLKDNTCTVYLQTSTHSPKHDTGIHIHSFGMKWGVKKPVISKRDAEFGALKDFDSPFNHYK